MVYCYSSPNRLKLLAWKWKVNGRMTGLDGRGSQAIIDLGSVREHLTWWFSISTLQVPALPPSAPLWPGKLASTDTSPALLLLLLLLLFWAFTYYCHAGLSMDEVWQRYRVTMRDWKRHVTCFPTVCLGRVVVHGFISHWTQKIMSPLFSPSGLRLAKASHCSNVASTSGISSSP